MIPPWPATTHRTRRPIPTQPRDPHPTLCGVPSRPSLPYPDAVTLTGRSFGRWLSVLMLLGGCSCCCGNWGPIGFAPDLADADVVTDSGGVCYFARG